MGTIFALPTVILTEGHEGSLGEPVQQGLHCHTPSCRANRAALSEKGPGQLKIVEVLMLSIKTNPKESDARLPECLSQYSAAPVSDLNSFFPKGCRALNEKSKPL